MKNEPLLSSKLLLQSALHDNKFGHAFPAKIDASVLAKAEIQKKIYSSYSSSRKDHGLKKVIDLLAAYYDANDQIGITLHDKNGIQVFANSHAKQLFNELKVETINHLWSNKEAIICINEKPVLLSNAPFIKALRTGKHQKQTFNIHMKDGWQRWLFFHSKPLLKKGEGVPGCIISSVIDITNEKQSAARLQERNELILHEKLRRQTEISETALRVQEMERTKIGQELHDNVNQLLSISKLFIEVMNPLEEKEKQAKEKSLEYIMIAIDEIRKLSRELAAPELKEKGLEESIQMLIDDIHFASALRFEFTSDPDLRLLSPDKKVVLFRIVQEQVKNIIKHSHAKTAGISFSLKIRDVLLQIWDDGKGFNPGQPCKGIGLSNMRERLLLYNGKVDVNAAPGKGCRLLVTLPIL